jgi:hypothetical protein
MGRVHFKSAKDWRRSVCDALVFPDDRFTHALAKVTCRYCREVLAAGKAVTP